MPQPSYAYACARLSALNKRLIEPQTILRMADGSASDAMRALSDVRYGNLSDATAADVERMIEQEMADAMQEVRELSPAPAITDLFLLRADVQNLKVLLKARLLNQSDTAFAPGGLFDRETLTAMVRDRQYGALPDTIRDALIALEKRLELHAEPQTISIALDRAYLAHALQQSKKNAVFSQYFKAEADFDNVLTFLRLRAMGSSIESLDEVILPAVAVRGNPAGLFQHIAALASLTGDQVRDLALADKRIAVAAETGIHKQRVQIAQTDGLAVDFIFTFT